MLYIDSNVFIYPVIYENQLKAKKAKELLLKIEDGEVSASTSVLTWDEVVWVVSKVLSRTDGINQGRKLLSFPNLEFISVDENVISLAQILLDKYDITPRDSMHLASAMTKKIKTIVSDDKDFDQIKEVKRIPLLSINFS